MDELKSRLTYELGQNTEVQIKHSEIWNLPVHPIKVDFETVRQTKMDVLMKMLLISFQKGDFSASDQLSDTLLVEQIFIEDRVQKMLRANLIEKKASVFTLTGKGFDQLASGTFIDQSEELTEKLLYSPCHGAFLQGTFNLFDDDSFEDYRMYNDYSNWEIEMIERSVVHEQLQSLIPVSETPNVQTVIAKINSLASLVVDVVPCIEFHLYDQSQAVFYARVWNTLLNEWDETLEGQIHAKERQSWYARYK